MTTVLKTIAGSLKTTDFVLGLALADLKGQDAWTRVRKGEGPSLAWQIGHMLDSRSMILSALTGAARESAFTAKSASAGGFAECVQDWKRVSGELDAAMEQATEESLSRMVKGGPHGEDTALGLITFLAWHEAYHVGAFGGIRKELGYPGPAELVMEQMRAAA